MEMEPKKTKDEDSILHLHDVFKIVGDQLNSRDVRVLKLMYNGIFTPEFLSHIHDGFSFLMALEKIDRVDESNFKNVENYLRMINRHDLFQYLTLRRRKTVFTDPVTQYLEQCSNANTLIPFSRKADRPSTSTLSSCDNACPSERDTATGVQTVNSASAKPGCLKRQNDSETSSSRENPHGNSKRHKSQPGSCSTEESGKRESTSADAGHSNISSPLDSPASCSNSRRENPSSQNCVKSRKTPVKKSPENIPRRRSERLKRRLENAPSGTDISFGVDISRNHSDAHPANSTSEEQQQRKKITCDIRLRVRAEYVNHQAALQGNVHSNKPEQIERQFEKFMQANTILKSRDLGSIICDIKFSELTYLDAFWRDYINGSLLEALKGVFITDSLKQAVGHEAIKLLVNVDEDDYEAGRLVLLNSLKNGGQ